MADVLRKNTIFRPILAKQILRQPSPPPHFCRPYFNMVCVFSGRIIMHIRVIKNQQKIQKN